MLHLLVRVAFPGDSPALPVGRGAAAATACSLTSLATHVVDATTTATPSGLIVLMIAAGCVPLA